jgi:hypothetical protein
MEQWNDGMGFNASPRIKVRVRRQDAVRTEPLTVIILVHCGTAIYGLSNIKFSVDRLKISERE